ncbi:hypothetical protein N136_00535 [Leifsonia aquatica ATCC 14665]|uniref:Uncharacterized protein n=1 Tax=Leifsonia aquatica ATCC 14665 TaxID=1358026 RepID=U2RD13_LEIAQ|nr:hypothetical protein N136_00535 [Leifsonia aquatica ATCC 14665]
MDRFCRWSERPSEATARGSRAARVGRRTGGAPAGIPTPHGEAETVTTPAWLLRSE